MKAYGAETFRTEAREHEFTNLYLESYALVFNYVRSRVLNNHDAEDIVASAFLQAARHFDNFDPARAKFSTWVITIAHNTMISHWRKNRPTSMLEDVPENLVSQSATQESLADRDLVDRLLASLNETERQLVIMKYRESYRNVEIAEELNMNASTVSTKLANALAKMRVIVENEMG